MATHETQPPPDRGACLSIMAPIINTSSWEPCLTCLTLPLAVITTEHTNILIRHFYQIGERQVRSRTLRTLPPLSALWELTSVGGWRVGGASSCQAAGAAASQRSRTPQQPNPDRSTAKVRTSLVR